MLRVKDIVVKTGWSEYRVLKLISLGRLPAVNVGAGKVPRWEVREQDLEAFCTPASKQPPSRVAVKRTRTIDDGVEDYFGSGSQARS